MSTTPGSRPSSGAIVGWLVAAVVLVGLAVLVVLNGSSVWNSFFPPEAKSVQGQAIRNLYDVVFAIAVVIFLLVEGLIVGMVGAVVAVLIVGFGYRPAVPSEPRHF